MRRYSSLCCTIVLCCLALSGYSAGKLVDGVLQVDGKPFFPLGGWDFSYTSPEDLARLGMNTSFRGVPQDENGLIELRQHFRDCAKRGIYVVAYLSYGGDMVEPWPVDAVRAASALAQEPNLLVWYVGDDITLKHLDGIRQTVSVLREQTPEVPTVADYIAEKAPEAKTVFTQYINIRCQYEYPIPNKSFAEYLKFFDDQRKFVGDPLWTWVQAFMWGSTGRALNLGAEGPGPIPDPEQVRLLAFAALNRGVRGLLFFAHHVLHRVPELAAETAWTCREISIFNDVLAAGNQQFNLETSDPRVNAAAFQYGDLTLISAAVFNGQYHHWVNEGIIKDLTITCPWNSVDLPEAVLVRTPDVLSCRVQKSRRDGFVEVTLPELELSGFVALTRNKAELERIREAVAHVPEEVGSLMVLSGAAQSRKASEVVWQLDLDNLYKPNDLTVSAMRANLQCADAATRGEWATAFRAWRESMRCSRRMLDTAMRFAQARENNLTSQEKRFLISPYGLRNLKGLGNMPASDDPWQFVRQFQVVGPYPLEWDGERSDRIPEGFNRCYPPEVRSRGHRTYKTLDGKMTWTPAGTDLSGLLDFLPYFKTTDNVVAYARCVVVSPRAQKARMSLGSNDGAKIFVNGQEVFSWCSVPRNGRTARQHQNEVEVFLNKGENEVIAKVENLGANWQLYLAFYDPQRELQFSLE